MKVNDRFFHFDGIKYFRRKALSVELGQIGRKRGKWIERDDSVDLRNEVIDDESFSFDYDSKSGVGFDAGVSLDSIPVLSPKGKVSLKVAKQQKAVVSLVKLSIEQDDLMDAINDDHRALRNMKSSYRMRAVNEIFVIISADLSESKQIDYDIEAEASVRGNAIDLNLEGSSGHNAKIKIDEGGTFAYLMVRESRRSRRQREIVDFRTDSYGLR